MTPSGIEPASVKWVTGLFPEEKRPVCGAGHPPPSIAKLKKSRAILPLLLWAFTVICMKILPFIVEAYLFFTFRDKNFNTRNAFRYENFRLPTTQNYFVKFPLFVVCGSYSTAALRLIVRLSEWVPSFISRGAAHTKRRERPLLAKEGTIPGI